MGSASDEQLTIDRHDRSALTYRGDRARLRDANRERLAAALASIDDARPHAESFGLLIETERKPAPRVILFKINRLTVARWYVGTGTVVVGNHRGKCESLRTAVDHVAETLGLDRQVGESST